MANSLSKTGITTGNTVETWHVTQSIDAFTGAEAYDITLSGSLIVTGSVAINGLSNTSQNDLITYNSTTGNLHYTSSTALVNGITAPLSSSIASLNSYTQSLNSVTGSWLLTSSFNAATGSFLTTASVSSNTITFTKGDGSTFPITVNTGSGGGGGSVDTGSFYYSSSISSSTITFFQGDGTTESVTLNVASAISNTFVGVMSLMTASITSPNNIPSGSWMVFINYAGSNTVALNLPHISASRLGDTIEIYTSASATGNVSINAPSTGRIRAFGTQSSLGSGAGAVTTNSTPEPIFKLIFNGASNWIVTYYADNDVFTDPSLNPPVNQITIS